MERKGVGFDQIYDVHGFRIIVDNYRASAMPRWASYTRCGIQFPASLTTTSPTPKTTCTAACTPAVRIKKDGRPVEIQIRTREMHEDAELGIAAHWQYKEQATHSKDVQEKINYLRQLMQEPLAADDSDDFVESMKTDVFSDRVLVFTPNADIIDLPAGSTPIDFAYAIHTRAGPSSAAAPMSTGGWCRSTPSCRMATRSRSSPPSGAARAVTG